MHRLTLEKFASFRFNLFAKNFALVSCKENFLAGSAWLAHICTESTESHSQVLGGFISLTIIYFVMCRAFTMQRQQNNHIYQSRF
jgi:hypothetical protein